MKEKFDRSGIGKSKGRTHSPKPRKPATNFSVSPTVKEFQEMKIKCEEEEEGEEMHTVVEAPPLPQPSPVVIPIRKGRKGSKWQASGFITKIGDQISSYTAENGVTYRQGDTIYLENPRLDNPYYVCSIKEFRLTKKDTLVVTIKWYFRSSEVPDSVYQLLVQDRHTENSTGRDSALNDPKIKSRELFISNASDTYPVKALRGKCKVEHFQDIYSAKNFKPRDDTFFYVLEYNPKTKRLATTQGEIRVGPSHQARLPEFRRDVPPSQMPENPERWEELRWRPFSVGDGDLMMYLRAARSVAAFAGMCDGGSTEDGCQAASMDETTMNAMDTLHRCNYDHGKALQALVKSPALRSIEKKWTEDELKRFVKGLRTYGKDFFKIRKELFPGKETGELIEYYYFWKKTPAAASNRPHRRHRRPPYKRNTRSTRPPSSGVEQSSASECSDDSDDSGGSRDLNRYTCRHCLTTDSKDWHHAGKDKSLRCTQCRLYYKRHGEERPLESPEDPPFLFKPVKEEADVLGGRHNMRTRQSRETGKGNKKKESNGVDPEDNQKTVNPKSPSSNSSCSTSSSDKDIKRDSKKEEPKAKGKKRQANSDSDDKSTKKKRAEDRSDSDSISDSSSSLEDLSNEGDADNNQDDLSSSPPSTPRSVDNTEVKTSLSSKSTSSSYNDTSQARAIVHPEPVIPSSSSPKPPSPKPLTSTPPITQHLTKTKTPLSLPLKPFCSHPDPIHVTSNSFSHSVFTSVNSLSSSDSTASLSTATSVTSSSSAIRPEPALHSPKVGNQKQESTNQPGLHKPVFVATQEPSTSLSVPDLKFSSNSSFAPVSRSPYLEQQTTLASTSVTPVYQNAISSSGMRDLNTIKKERVTPPPLESFTSTGFKPRDFIESDNRKKAENINFDLSHVKSEPTLDLSIGSKQFPSLLESSGIDKPPTDRRGTEEGGTSQTEVKSEKSQEIDMDDGDSDREGGVVTRDPTPEPPPVQCNVEVHTGSKDTKYRLIKVLDRGSNICSRCDIVLKALSDSKLAQKQKSSGSVSSNPPQQTPVKPEEKKKLETPPPNSTADAQITSSLISTPHHFDRQTPRSYPPDTPALRQLSEYAKKPTISMGGEPSMSHPSGPYGPYHPGMDPLLNYRMGMYPPGSRERLELELERDKRERDAREREIREREIREMEMREKMKQDLEMKPPGLERLLPPHGPSPMDPQWLEFQRRYGSFPPAALGHPGGPSGSHIPGVYPPNSIASDLMQRERERLERLDILRSDQMTGRMIYQICTQRLTNEQIYMQRVTNECILRSKHEWGAGGVIDPAASQLVYQFNRADPLAVSAAPGTPSAHLSSLPAGIPPHAGLLSRGEQEMLQNEFYRRAYADPGLAHQLSAQAAQHEAIQRQLAMERERFGHLPPH
ncbi:arginine-glutamic acid dipeptide repeats protein-like isoform X2 [Saccostrea echinata]|uniref:arginine-glutamic acid dipeptide repeats protein-like isoform X2 n=1 Tax=Saccostrea echinata TaxID=191078 RepID=UPI002A83A607|nr:arginine-glutamic acid dipeptide repeats protein-like isoform X2 [Saccostrea echinata]